MLHCACVDIRYYSARTMHATLYQLFFTQQEHTIHRTPDTLQRLCIRNGSCCKCCCVFYSTCVSAHLILHVLGFHTWLVILHHTHCTYYVTHALYMIYVTQNAYFNVVYDADTVYYTVRTILCLQCYA